MPAVALKRLSCFQHSELLLLLQHHLSPLLLKTLSWCVASGGPRNPNNDPCVVLVGINGLLVGVGACAQQNNADAMVDFAKLPVPGINNKQAH
jgi:hypothetical protein